MEMTGKRIGFALTGSFCTFAKVLPQVQALVEAGAQVFPIASRAVAETDTRFGRAEDFLRALADMTGREPLSTLAQVEPIGPRRMIDLLIVAPCTGNTLAKLAAGIADTPVTLACKAHLRNEGPLLLAPSTNDGLGTAAKNIGALLAARSVFFVPFGQDDPQGKPRSLVAHMERIPEAAEAALAGRQLQPVLV